MSRPIEPADITTQWARTMEDQISLEESWDNEPNSELYPTPTLLASNQTKWMDTLKTLLTMIRDTKGVPLAAVTRRLLIPKDSSNDPGVGKVIQRTHHMMTK